MDIAIPLGKMTVAEKFRALELIWDDLQRGPETVPSPAWHEDVLRARELRARSGVSTFSDWNAAKARVRKNAQ